MIQISIQIINAVNNMATDMDSASASEIESDTDSTKMSIPIPRREELFNRIASLEQENKVLKMELETYKIKCKNLVAENRDLRKASVNIVSCRVSCMESQLLHTRSVGRMAWAMALWRKRGRNVKKIICTKLRG